MSCLRTKRVTIRKPRPCFGCLESIPAGCFANIQTNVDSGSIWDITLCGNCQEKALALHHDDEFGEGDLKDA